MGERDEADLVLRHLVWRAAGLRRQPAEQHDLAQLVGQGRDEPDEGLVGREQRAIAAEDHVRVEPDAHQRASRRGAGARRSALARSHARSSIRGARSASRACMAWAKISPAAIPPQVYATVVAIEAPMPP